MIYHTFECGCWFACLFPCFFQESKFKKYVFKVLKIRFVLKFFLVHGRIFPQWELAGSLQLKSRHSFFPSWPCACCQTSLKKKKQTSFVYPESLLRRGTFLLVRNCVCGIHTLLTLMLCRFQWGLGQMEIYLPSKVPRSFLALCLLGLQIYKIWSWSLQQTLGW